MTERTNSGVLKVESRRSVEVEDASAESSNRPIVLLVDDDELVRQAYRDALRRSGFEIHTAATAQEALSLIASGTIRFDVILSDVMMPGMDGIALLREVRQYDLDIPVLLLTGHPQFSSAMAAVNLGGFNYLTKPIANEALAAAVKQAVGMHRLARLKRKAFATLESSTCPGDRTALEVHFAQALDGLWMAFQPIVDVSDDSLFGYEAFLRSDSAVLPNPSALLDAAERLGRLQHLGRTIRSRVAAAIPAAPESAVILVNLHASDLNDEDLYDPRAPLSRYARRIVLEITERSSLDEVHEAQSRVARLRELGYRVAVDDLGVGYAGLSSFSLLEPEVAKLDVSLIRQIDSSPSKQSLVKSMISVCTRELQMQVVCEGVETMGERHTLHQLGATLMQGYLFGRPGKEFAPYRFGATDGSRLGQARQEQG